MFARGKRISPPPPTSYLVENVREDGRSERRIIANLGRKEVVSARRPRSAGALTALPRLKCSRKLRCCLI